MNKLLCANFKRMWKNKFFWLGIIFMAAMGILFSAMPYMQMKANGFKSSIDSTFFSYVLFISIITSVLCSLFIGTEYSDGTMRNKAIVGHTRVAVYLSNLLVCMAAALIMCFAYIVPMLCVGIPLLGFFQTKIMVVLGMVLSSFVLTAALTAIYTLVAMVNRNKATTVTICILGIFCMVIIGTYLNSRLAAPKMYPAYIMTEGAAGTASEEKPNPQYLEGTQRDIFQFLLDFTPGGQVVQLSNMPAKAQVSNKFSAHLWLLTLYSAFILVATTGLGVYFFRKKDLN